MANPTQVDHSFQTAFENAIREFRTQLKDEEIYQCLLQVKTVDEVYDLTDKLQAEQARMGRLRHLSKIHPFLEGLRNYASVIEVFMQAKPDVLALIWGPIKLILQWADVLKQSMDAIIDTAEEIGTRLPEFQKTRTMFGTNKVIFEVLVLFFKDILDFYVVALKFFSSPRLKFIFEALWPRQRDKIKVIAENIGKHTLLLRNEVRLEHIQAEYSFRKQALEHFEKSEVSHLQQEYRSLQTDISPPSYEETLAHLDDCTRPNAVMWLIKHDKFLDWVDTTKQSTRVLWLQGIPGSGKSHLARAAVHEVQAKGHSLFAFLSYKASKSLSTVSILHSLIFQLAADEFDLQSIVCNSCGPEFRRDSETVQSVFKTLLCSTGPVYIILDGLDEIEESTRCRILRILLQLSTETDTLRVLVCSRPEQDIMTLLRDKCSEIRVDEHNGGGIHSYVSQRTSAWYNERQFSTEVRDEMKTLLAPFVVKSKGMFLYAKVVLDGIDALEPEEIRGDLEVLPESLNDAYHRVLERINNSPSQIAKEKARMIIGWIAVSPTRLTIYELEQALVVHAQGINGTGKVSSRLPFLRLCGPIIEFIDEYVQYVHFTVHEYFLSPQISNSIDLQESRISLARSCIQYLCQYHHEPSIDPEARSKLVIEGAYRFHHYATSFWLELLESTCGSRKGPIRSMLIDPLEILFEIRGKVSRNSDDLNDEETDFQNLKTQNPKLHAMMSRAISFPKIYFKSGYELRKSFWTNLDPLDISHTSCQIFEQTEKLVEVLSDRDSHVQQALQNHYGKRLYKCAYLECAFKRHGFDSHFLRQAHEKGHKKPWRCSFVDCEYHEGGFLSRKMRDNHLDSFHFQNSLCDYNKISNMPKEDLEHICLDLVRANDLSGLRHLANNDGINGPRIWQAAQFTQCAAQFASFELLMFLYTDSSPSPWSHVKAIIRGATEGNNVDLFRSLLFPDELKNEDLPIRRFRAEFHSSVGYSISWVMKSHNPEILDMMCSWIPQDIEKRNMAYPVYSEMISATSGDTYKEDLLLELWKKLPKDVWNRRNWMGALANVASTTCSLKLAEFLFGKNVPIDWQPNKRSYTALLHASKKDNAAAAELIKRLLYKGAKIVVEVVPRFEIRGDDGGKKYNVHVAEQKGAQNISKWLGVTWDELVAGAEMARGQATDSTV